MFSFPLLQFLFLMVYELYYNSRFRHLAITFFYQKQGTIAIRTQKAHWRWRLTMLTVALSKVNVISRVAI